jgi:hypothetical protein
MVFPLLTPLLEVELEFWCTHVTNFSVAVAEIHTVRNAPHCAGRPHHRCAFRFLTGWVWYMGALQALPMTAAALAL